MAKAFVCLNTANILRCNRNNRKCRIFRHVPLTPICLTSIVLINIVHTVNTIINMPPKINNLFPFSFIVPCPFKNKFALGLFIFNKERGNYKETRRHMHDTFRNIKRSRGLSPASLTLSSTNCPKTF